MANDARYFDIEDFITRRIAAHDRVFEGDRQHRAWESWVELCDPLWPYVCLTAGLRRLHGHATSNEMDLLDATPEILAAKKAWTHG